MEQERRMGMIRKKMIRLAAVLAAAAVFLTLAIRFSIAGQEAEKEEQAKGLGEMLAEADREREEQEEEAEEEGVVTLRWAFTEVGQHTSVKPYETALNQVLKKKGLPWRVSFSGLECSEDNSLAGPLAQRRQMKEENYDIVSCLDSGYYLLYGMLAREGLLEPLDLRMEGTEEGGRLKEVYPETVWDAVRVKGRIYGIPTISSRLNGLGYYLVVNEELAEKYQISLEDFTAEELEQAFRTVTDGEWAAGNTAFCGGEFPDWNVDSQKTLMPFIRISLEGGEARPVNVLEDEAYLKFRKQTLDLLCEGYLFRGDSCRKTEKEIQKGRFFAMPAYGYSAQAVLRRFRHDWKIGETVRLKILEFPKQNEVYYDGSGKAGIWAGSEQKEEAFALLAAIYSDAELSDALAYGLPGRDYQTEDGKVISDPNNIWEGYWGNSLLTRSGWWDSDKKEEELGDALASRKESALSRFDFDPQKVLYEWQELWRIYEGWEELCHCRKEDRPLTGPETCDCNKTWEQDLEAVRKAVKDAGIDRVMEYMEEILREQEAYRNGYPGE